MEILLRGNAGALDLVDYAALVLLCLLRERCRDVAGDVDGEGECVLPQQVVFTVPCGQAGALLDDLQLTHPLPSDTLLALPHSNFLFLLGHNRSTPILGVHPDFLRMSLFLDFPFPVASLMADNGEDNLGAGVGLWGIHVDMALDLLTGKVEGFADVDEDPWLTF